MSIVWRGLLTVHSVRLPSSLDGGHTIVTEFVTVWRVQGRDRVAFSIWFLIRCPDEGLIEAAICVTDLASDSWGCIVCANCDSIRLIHAY